ncbi:hypothetical protein C0993_007637 [Termitomyces sp. T159_Od127]|nr:hypothetical protein C0993_007637 [Termitomyces sp. T159_Od127]
MDGQPAVLEILRNEERDSEANAINEVRNLKTVHQLLERGHDLYKSIFHIVMRKMGEPYEIASKKAQGALSNVRAWEEAAYTYYERTYGLKHL